VRLKSMCFWLSTRTMNEGMLTTCLPTLGLIGERRRGRGGQRVALSPVSAIKKP
jgi:hypothetical protein